MHVLYFKIGHCQDLFAELFINQCHRIGLAMNAFVVYVKEDLCVY